MHYRLLGNILTRLNTKSDAHLSVGPFAFLEKRVEAQNLQKSFEHFPCENSECSVSHSVAATPEPTHGEDETHLFWFPGLSCTRLVYLTIMRVHVYELVLVELLYYVKMADPPDSDHERRESGVNNRFPAR